MATRVTVPRTKRFRLRNGLSVVLAPIAGAPTASVWVWYKVGSKNESIGITGASHWVEHMLFLGSPRYPKGTIDRAIIGVGGELNAFTDVDFTAYFSTVPAEHVGVPLDIEADRMTRAAISTEEVDRERTVVLSEREGAENWPEFLAEEELLHLAFKEHPYRWDPLGYPSDIRSMNAEDLGAYYRRFYGPKNAVLVVAGGIDVPAVERTVRRLFSGLPAIGDDPTVRRVEPPPTAERRGVVRGPGTTPLLLAGWRSPGASDPGAAAAIALDVLLGGGSRFFASEGGSGRGREHASSRLYRGLVDRGLAVRVSSDYRPRLHPGLFTVDVQAAPGVAISKVEEALDAEIEKLRRSPPTGAEMDDLRTKVRESAALAYEGATRQGMRLGYLSALGPPGLEARLLTSLLGLRPPAIRDAARSLFRPEARVVVVHEPGGGPRAG